MRRSFLFLIVVLLFPAALQAQQDPQQPRPPRKDARGLLKINRQYYDLSAATGGDFYFWAPGEFAAAAPIDIPNGGDDVVLAYGSLEGSKSVFEIPVESGAKKLTIFCGIQRKDLAVIVRPDDSPLRHDDPGVKIQSLQHMTIAAIDSPAPGIWSLELTGFGAYSISGKLGAGSDAPSLDSFEFVEPGGRPGHEGLFPIKRAPKQGEILTARADLSGSVSKLEFLFVASDGSQLGRCPLAAHEGEWLGNCTAPKLPFRVVVTGLDTAGRRFRRIESGMITPE